MGLQQNRDKMPKFASLSNYTYQIRHFKCMCKIYVFYIIYCCYDELLMLKSI